MPATAAILLEGPQTFYFENGAQQWTANFHLGKKVGDEAFYRADGSKEWTKILRRGWHMDAGGSLTPSGKQTAESHWRGKTLVDVEFRGGKVSIARPACAALSGHC